MSEELSRKLGYQFKNPKLLQMALTHRSKSDNNNERLEFLGDSIVNFVIADALYEKLPKAQEGDLSRFRASYINRDTLGSLGSEFDLGHYLILGAGELKSGGSKRISIISCAMEAIIGAIYLDGGFEQARDCILKWYEPLLAEIKTTKSRKDPKTELQEFLQSHRMSLPVYHVDSIEGESHNQIFIVSCEVDKVAEVVVGKGTSRRRAEQEAASIMLGILRK